jgi:hypothetical protein
MDSSFLRFFLDHTQRRTTIGKIPLDEWSARRRDLYLTTHDTHNRQISMPPDGIRTHNFNRRAATELRLIPRGYLDRRNIYTGRCKCKEIYLKRTSLQFRNFLKGMLIYISIPLAAGSKAWVWIRSLAGIMVSNPAGSMEVCLLWMLCVVR